MAISIVKFREKKAYGVYEFLCDFDSDVKDLRTDCAPGSKAQVAESGKNYVFNSLKQWKEVESSGGSWTGTVWDKLGGDIDLSGYQPKIDSTHKLSSDLVDDTGNTNKFVTSTDKTNWNAKYDKPSGGIPKTDLASDVQTSLGKADTALQEHQDISGKANKISVVQTSTSTIEINPNTFYKFGEVASLNITLASITDNTIYNEYMFEFVSGTTATTLTLPSSIKWLETPTIDANKIYQCSIVDNIGLLVGVANV